MNRQIAEFSQFGGFLYKLLFKTIKHLFKFSYAFLDFFKIRLLRLTFNQ